jgi:ABC-type bacteriocin/lantibiotic exporter with double-glycine peptidase domain
VAQDRIDARLLILDEPPSSLDPLAEAEPFHRFRELLDGRSAIIIGHRFSTVQLADCIYVMDQAASSSAGHIARCSRSRGVMRDSIMRNLSIIGNRRPRQTVHAGHIFQTQQAIP